MKTEISTMPKWGKNFLNTRYELLEILNLNYNSINGFILIEEYDSASTFYGGLMYVDENNLSRFNKRSYWDEFEVVQNPEISKTENFIIRSIKNSNIDDLKNESLSSKITSPNPLYITIVKRDLKGKFKIEVIKLRSFIID